jgi:hypothetical protein
MQLQPITGTPISLAQLPKRVRVADVPKIYRTHGYIVVCQRGELLAVRIH